MTHRQKFTQRMIEESILFAINECRLTVQNSIDDEAVAKAVERIKTLAEAYDIVHRGRKEK